MRVSRGFQTVISVTCRTCWWRKFVPHHLVHPDRLWPGMVSMIEHYLTSPRRGGGRFRKVSPRKQTRWCFSWMSIGVKDVTVTIPLLGGDFNWLFFLFLDGETYFFCSTLELGEMIQFDEHMFQMGWFNHQLDVVFKKVSPTSYSKWPFDPLLGDHLY